MKRRFIFMILVLTCLVSKVFASETQNEDYINLQVVSLHTVLGNLKNPDIFFEDTIFQSIKPTVVLGNKAEYSLYDKLTGEIDIKKMNELIIHKNIPFVYVYEIKKNDSDYSFCFIPSNCGSNGDIVMLKGKTALTGIQEQKKYADKIKENGGLESMKNAVKICEVFSKVNFDRLPVKIFHETADFIETLCFIDGAYIWTTFRKIYK